MSAGICLIAPYPELVEVARAIETDIAFDAIVANLEDAVMHLPVLEAGGCSVLVSRGKTAHLLREHTRLPVIDIRIGTHDALTAMADLVHSNARIAIVGHPDVVRRCGSVAFQLGLEADVLPLEDDGDDGYARLEATVRTRFAADRIDVMIGDTIPRGRFSGLAESFRLISSSAESVREALGGSFAGGGGILR